MPKRKHTGGQDSVSTGDPSANGMMSGRTFLERVGDTPAQVSRNDPHPASGQPASGLLDEQPALQRPGWLPEGLFPELDELREEHHEHLNGGHGDKKRALVEQYEAEDAARAEAMRLGNDVPAVTPTAERQDALSEAEAEREAGVAKLRDFIDRAVVRLHELEPVWRQRLTARRAGHAAEVEQAKAALQEAEREVAKVDQAEQWVNRTVNPRGGRYQPAPAPGDFMTDAEREEYRLGQHAKKLEVGA